MCWRCGVSSQNKGAKKISDAKIKRTSQAGAAGKGSLADDPLLRSRCTGKGREVVGRPSGLVNLWGAWEVSARKSGTGAATGRVIRNGLDKFATAISVPTRPRPRPPALTAGMVCLKDTDSTPDARSPFEPSSSSFWVQKRGPLPLYLRQRK